MTTNSFSTVIDHSSDAGFRAWGSEFSAKLAAVGMVQTADTGQINWVTVTRPGISTVGGYEIWRFNDSLQGTAPIYFKVEYGTGAGTTQPNLWLTVGTGSNGSGTITGTATTRATCARGVAMTGGTSYPSYFCHVDGYVGAVSKYGASASVALMGFIIARTCDSTGAPSATGCVVYMSPTTIGATAVATVQALRFAATAQVFAASNAASACLVPHSVASSAVGSDIQAFLHWMPTPRIAPVFPVCSYVVAEISTGSTFAATLVGTTSRTFIALGVAISSGAASSSSYGMAMVWE